MIKIKQFFGIIVSFFVFWFSMLGVQRLAEFFDIDALKFMDDQTGGAHIFYSPYPFLIVFIVTLISLYFFVVKLEKPKKEEVESFREE
ncbi:DUF3935 domain-containing protein [Bacillus cereus]|uniref:DUF3935 domain-containing protein n=1 Tax=Bacillus TaxID=1386 RepID=UPI000553C9BA|nr:MULTISPECIES: DUF3935 domain-containing protein [unclassified Bacillus (in: firmicutes)]